jgi:quercetin dioxygenase-like cupin family protein
MLSSFASYQQGAIVSREIVRKAAGTVTVFAFDKGQGLSEHTAPYDAMVYAVEGKARITISGSDAELNAGQFIILPAGKPHTVHATGQFKMLLVMIRSEK